MRLLEVRVQYQRALAGAHDRGPVEFALARRRGPGEVRLGEVGIEMQRGPHLGLRTLAPDARLRPMGRTAGTCPRRPSRGLREPARSRNPSRALSRSARSPGAWPQAVAHQFGPAAQVVLVGGGVAGVAAPQLFLLGGGQTKVERGDDPLGDDVLEAEQLIGANPKGFGPDGVAARRVAEPRRDADLVAASRHFAAEDECRLTNRLRGEARQSRCQRRGSRRSVCCMDTSRWPPSRLEMALADQRQAPDRFRRW